MKQLFITTRNIISTSGELRLIKNRNNAIKRMEGITTDYIVLIKKSRLQDENIEDLGGEHELNIITYKDRSIFSFILAYSLFFFRVLHVIRKDNYSIICFSG